MEVPLATARAPVDPRIVGPATPPPYLSKRSYARHSAFTARYAPSPRVQSRHDLIVRILVDENGASLNAIEINQRIAKYQPPFAMVALYRDLKQLAASGRVHHEWSLRNGRVSSAYRSIDHPVVKARLVCKSCEKAVELHNADALTRLVAQACEKEGMVLSEAPVEFRVLCQRCQAAKDS
ncbi:hypothetical protein DBV14_04620 [Variovorax sp. KBW07]|nr:hypothetical protein DBV14_04620 [Variovorax sp. KBW07]